MSDSCDGEQHLALADDLALALAGGHAEVGLARLAGAVDDAAHDGDAQRDVDALERLLHLLGEGVDVDLGPPHDGQDTTSRPRSRRCSDSRMPMPALTSSTGSADSDTRIVSPMPSASSVPMPTADLMMPVLGGPASVTPRCSG
jgi:hypothetical protein